MMKVVNYKVFQEAQVLLESAVAELTQSDYQITTEAAEEPD